MYLIGIVLAGYYDWWLVKTAQYPNRWMFVFCLANIPVMISLSYSQVLGLVFYAIAFVFVIPAFLAAFKNIQLQDGRVTGRMNQIKKMDRLLKNYPLKK